MTFQKLLPLIFLIAFPFLTHAQVTTGTITGHVNDSTGKALEGATITVTHMPTGTVYNTLSRKDGVFNLPNVKVGGPYEIKVEYVGYNAQIADNINILLGEPYDINVIMQPIETITENVIVTSVRRRSGADKTGATTVIGTAQLSTLPTISRSITDFTRITPQSNGTSFAGRDNRMNNVTVDGANLNNNFGLSSDLLPGGGNPISLDAYQEISVNISPFDVKQSGFTGAGVNAITKSGTNEFHGSLYGAFRNENYNGTNVAGTKLPDPPAQSNKIYGVTVGGPIIKNKIFFFVNAELEKTELPGVTYTPAGGSGSGTASQVPIDSLKKLSDYLNTAYNFNPGPYDNFPTFNNKNHKLLGKIDWNISNVHKLTLKYSDYSSTSYGLISQSGGINGASGTGIVSYQPRFGLNAMSFENVNYSIDDKVKTGSIELNSNFNSRFSNQFLATFTKITSFKGHDGATFPFVDIIGGPEPLDSKYNYLSFGNEPFNGNNNKVLNNVLTITDNFMYYAGKHTLTFGANYEYQKVGNMFMAGSQGYYVYGSLNDFITNAPPKLFSINYSLVQGQDAVYSANLKMGQLGVYVQDEYNVNPRLKLTAGIRVDKPIFPENPLENPAITAIDLYSNNTSAGPTTNYNGGEWPKAGIYLAPRISARWDVKGDKSLIIRGGTGIFTGRVPFVYLTNQPSTSGMYTFGALVTTTSVLQQITFNPDAHAYNPFYNKNLDPTLFPTKAGTIAPSGGFSIISHDFRFPQVWRTDIAVEKRLGAGWTATIEGLFTKDLNDPVMFNANQNPTDTVVNIAPGEVRGRFTSSDARKLNSSIANAIILENTHKGGSVVLTAQLAKSFSKGWYASVAYTYTLAKDITANPGSQAASVWSVNPTSGTQNDYELGYSSYAVPHRIVAYASYRLEYAHHLASTFTLYYEGASQGTYSYIYNGDINNDGNFQDLMYIPKNPSEITFVDIPENTTNGTPAFTAQQQSDAFFQYIAQDKYLSKHQGENAKRYGAKYPFYNRVDFNFSQDIFTNIGKSRNSLQFNLAITNLLNLLNHDWGVRKLYIVNNPLKVVSVVNGTPLFQLATYKDANGNTDLIRQTFINNNSTASTWGLQLGFKYIF